MGLVQSSPSLVTNPCGSGDGPVFGELCCSVGAEKQRSIGVRPAPCRSGRTSVGRVRAGGIALLEAEQSRIRPCAVLVWCLLGLYIHGIPHAGSCHFGPVQSLGTSSCLSSRGVPKGGQKGYRAGGLNAFHSVKHTSIPQAAT